MYEQFGKIFKDRYFIKNVNAKHFMKKYQGFGISTRVLMELKEKGVEFVIHVYTKISGDKEYWLTTIDKFKESNLTHLFNDADLQKFVATNQMTKIDPEDYDF